MSDFEYDNEFDAIEDQEEVQEHKKKPISKEAPKTNQYARKRDTDDSYDHFEPIDHAEDDEKPAANNKKPQPLAPINNKPDLKSNRVEESKPKFEEKTNPKPTLSTEPKKSETKIKEEAKSKQEEKKVEAPKKNVWEDEDEVEVVEKKEPSPRRNEKPDTNLSNYKKNEKVATEEDDYENVVVEKKPEPKRETVEEIDVKPKKPPINTNILENKFDAAVVEGRGPQFDRLKDQNQKLKSELRALAKAADEALQRERQNRANKRPQNVEEGELKDKMQELKDQLSKIDQLRHQIGIMKRQLENTYNLPKVIEKEDALRAAQRELAKVTEEKNSLMKIKKDQNKAMDNINNEGEYDRKLKQVTEELRKAKEDYRKQNEIYLENDKMMKKLHEKIIVMEEKCKELQKKIKDKKNEKPTEQTEEITEENIQLLEARLEELKDKKASLDKNFDEEMKNLERKKRALQTENQKLAQYLKEKEKEIRLNNLRLKELRKLTKLSQIKLPERELPRKNSLSEGRRTPSGEREDGNSKKQSLGAKKASEERQLNKVPSKKSQPETKKPAAPQSTNRDEDEYGEENFEEEVQDMPESSNRVQQKRVEPRAEENEAKNNIRSTEKLFEQNNTSNSRSPDVHEHIDAGEDEADKGVFSKPSFLKKKK